MQTFQDWVKGRPLASPGRFNLFSFAIFSTLCLAASIALGHWPVFAILFVIDGLGTLSTIDVIVASSRSLFFLMAILITALSFPLDLFVLSLEILGLLAFLDFSILLRKVDGTGVDISVLTKRLRSYTLTLLPAFLLTYLLLFFYSVNLQFDFFEATLFLALGAGGIFISVYAVSRYLLSLDRRS